MALTKAEKAAAKKGVVLTSKTRSELMEHVTKNMEAVNAKGGVDPQAMLLMALTILAASIDANLAALRGMMEEVNGYNQS